MKIKLHQIKISQIISGYSDKDDEGVYAMDGKLNIRPPYQREFVYKQAQRDAVIKTVLAGFPLNTMYWAKNGDDEYEVIDGQQRTISICQFAQGDFSVGADTQGNPLYFDGMPSDQKQAFLDYELMVYICEGTDKEKLDWFRVINIAGAELKPQELLNAVYVGPWLADAKKRFSKNGSPAQKIGSKLVKGEYIRQAYLERALQWISNGKVADYMAKHQNDPNALPLWSYFESVINWVNNIFPNYHQEMKGVDWGELYNKHKDDSLDPNTLSREVSRLMEDKDVKNKYGIFTYLLTKEQKWLNIRAFDDSDKRSRYEEQQGICPRCKKHFEIEQMEGDHITPWVEGGKTVLENLQMLCRDCNRRKGKK